MSAAAAPTDGPARRHRQLFDAEQWRRNRLWMLYPGVLFLGVGVAGLFIDPPRTRASTFEFIFLGALLLCVAGYFYWRRQTRYATAAADALVLRAGRRRCAIPYERVRWARTQAVHVLFDSPSRRGLLQGPLRRYSNQPACVVRLDPDPELLAGVRRVLGKRAVVEQDVLLAVELADGLTQALQPAIRRRPPAPAARPGRRRR